MTKMKLEDKITRNEATYIHSLEYNSKDKQFTLALDKSPQLSKTAAKSLTFSNVSNFHIDEEIRNSVDQIMGIGEYNENEKVKYVLLTEQRTFTFLTDKEPMLSDLP